MIDNTKMKFDHLADHRIWEVCGDIEAAVLAAETNAQWRRTLLVID